VSTYLTSTWREIRTLAGIRISQDSRYIQEATLSGSLSMPIYESELVNLIFGDFSMKKFSLSVLTLLVIVGFSGCSTRLGNMTVVSTNNVDGLATNVTTEHRVKGESCNHSFLIIPWGDFQNRLQIATDNAIDNGHNAGLVGDVLVNAKINVTSWTAILYSQNCLTVEGDLIPLAKSMK
jgi:hypothetical protein